jgi:hypothetical protein
MNPPKFVGMDLCLHHIVEIGFEKETPSNKNINYRAVILFFTDTRSTVHSKESAKEKYFG